VFDLVWYQYLFIALIFIWSGFVRSGLGFGGAALSLPFLLLVDNQPLIFLPIIAIHLLIFSSITVFSSHRKASKKSDSPEGGERAGNSGIDWKYLRYTLRIMVIPMMVGVFGLITLPPALMSGIIFSIVFIYAVGYIANRPFKSGGKALDLLLLVLGGYVSGTSLIGAPLIIPVYANHVSRDRLRDTLFVLWFIIVTVKVAAFIFAEVDLQLGHQLWLLPCAAIGHVLGLHFHERLVQGDTTRFFRVLGTALLIISTVGLVRGLM